MTAAPPGYSVAVVIPTWNKAPFLPRALESVLAQTRPADEIIVVDDGSTDNTPDVVASYANRIRYLRQDNAGASAARNAGIRAATAHWIAFLDGDDEWLPDKLERQLALLERNPALAWVSGNYQRCLCWENRRCTQHSPDQARTLLAGREYYQDFWQAYRRGVYGCTDTMLVARSVLHDVGLFDTTLTRDEDLDLWWRIAYRHGRLGYVPEPLAIYHLDVPASTSRTVRPGAAYGRFIRRHLDYAQAAGQAERFAPVAAYTCRRWIRAMLFEADKNQIRQVLDVCRPILPRPYVAFIRTLSIFPSLTARACRLISRLVRTLKLRPGVHRKPPAGANTSGPARCSHEPR